MHFEYLCQMMVFKCGSLALHSHNPFRDTVSHSHVRCDSTNACFFHCFCRKDSQHVMSFQLSVMSSYSRTCVQWGQPHIYILEEQSMVKVNTSSCGLGAKEKYKILQDLKFVHIYLENSLGLSIIVAHILILGVLMWIIFVQQRGKVSPIVWVENLNAFGLLYIFYNHFFPLHFYGVPVLLKGIEHYVAHLQKCAFWGV